MVPVNQNPQIILTKVDNLIEFKIKADIYCKCCKKLIPNSGQIHQTDNIWINFFGSNKRLKKFLANNRKEIINKSINFLGYDKCDKVIKNYE